VAKSLPPLKIPFSERRSSEFLYLPEVDALIAATQKTRSITRNSALAMLLFCQALQPLELCWLPLCDVNFTDTRMLVVRNRSKSTRLPQQIITNLQRVWSKPVGGDKQVRALGDGEQGEKLRSNQQSLPPVPLHLCQELQTSTNHL
jgi:hypothetical protein